MFCNSIIVLSQEPVYPIIFIHGLNSDDTTWDQFVNFLNTGNIAWGNKQTFHITLNSDHNSTLYENDVIEAPGNIFSPETHLFAINFHVYLDNEGVWHFYENETLLTPDSQSNESSIYKQGGALGRAIKSILNKTQAEKVVLVTHSMGGLAAREYLQRIENGQPKWWVYPDETEGHRVAKLVTTGTPHLGSNAVRLGSVKGINPISEAARDLTYDYNNISAPPNLSDNGVYLFGGMESQIPINLFPFGTFFNRDVNCNSITDEILGINSNIAVKEDNPSMPLPANAEYTWIVSVEGDIAVRSDRQYLQNKGDTLNVALTHGKEPKDAYSLVRALDEPDEPNNAYKIQVGKTYNGFTTFQPNFSPGDTDWFKFDLNESGFISLTVSNVITRGTDVTTSIQLFAGNNLTNPLVSGNNNGGLSTIQINSPNLGSDEYFIKILGTPEEGGWQNPYTLKLDFIGLPTNFVVSPSISAIFADGSSATDLNAEIRDSAGNFIPNASNPVTFTITSGAQSAQLVGPNPATPVNGKATIVLQSTTTPGIVTIEASSPGLTSSSTSVVVYASGSETEVSGTISTNTTWTLAGSPYVVTGDITVKAGVKLTIEPGVTVKLNDNKDIFVNGGLFAKGTVNSKIIFTANSASPTPGYWGGIQFNESAIDSICILNNVIMEYGGDTGQAIDHPLVLDPRANPTITNTTLERNRTNGIAIKSGAYSSDILLDVTSVPYMVFGDLTVNQGAVLHINPGVILKMGSATFDLIIRGGLIVNGANLNRVVFTSIRDDSHGGDTNGDGPSNGAPGDWGGVEFRDTVNDANASLNFCDILYAGATSQAVDYPILLDARANPSITNTTISNSRVNGIGVKGGNYSSDVQLDITGLPYLVPNMTIKSGATFSIAPGVLLKMLDNADISIEGGFIAQGTSRQHIVFTSFRDDSRGGDTNGDGNTDGAPGDWGGIGFTESIDDSKSRMTYCDIYFGGQGGFGNFDAPIELDARANPQIMKVQLEENRVNGIDLGTGTYKSDILLDITDLPYMIRGDLTIDAGATMRINPGVLLKFSDRTDLFIKGGLVADGTEEAHIIFTSIRDDSRGGDTNNDGSTAGSPGDWGGIRFEATTDDANALLRYCEINYGGQGGFGNNNSPIVLDGRANPVIDMVTLNDNRLNGIWLINQTYNINIDLDITDLPYILGGDLTVGASAQLTIHPGTLFKMGDKTDIFVDGTLRAVGEASQPIVFTSFNDDSRGGDTDGTGVTSGVPGDWGGIRFRDTNDEDSIIEHTELYFAGQGGFGNNDSPLVCDNASPKIQNVVIADTKNHGVRCENAASPDLGGGQSGGFGGNRFIGFLNQTSKYAVLNNGTADVFAKFNYWETTDNTLIDQIIFDVKDNAGKGRVIYQPVAAMNRVALTNFGVTPFPAEVNSPLTFSGTVELDGEAKQVEISVEDPISLATRIVPVQSDGSFSYTTSMPVNHVDTYLFHFGAFGSKFETVVIPTRPSVTTTTSPPSAVSLNIPLLSAKLAFKVGKLGKFIGLDSPINILGEQIELSGAEKAVEEQVFAELLDAKKEYFKQVANNLEHLYKENSQLVVSEGVTALATILVGGGIDLRGILVANAELISEAIIVSLIQTLLERIGQNSPEVQQFLKKPGIIVSLVSMQARKGINTTQIAIVQALLDNDEIDEITIQEIERRLDGSIISLILQIVSKAGERFGIVAPQHGTGNMVSVIGNSPIDLIVTDPEGRRIGKEIQEIPKAHYLEADIDGDGELEDEIVIFDGMVGNYFIEVIPEPNANPNDTYSLFFVGDADTTVLAQDVALQDIPSEPYNMDYTTHVSEPLQVVPNQFSLEQNYPNPFNPTTTIEFRLPKPHRVTLKIFNIRGQVVRTLVDEGKPAGIFKVDWDGENEFGERVSSGIYIYHIKAGEFVASRKLLLIR